MSAPSPTLLVATNLRERGVSPVGLAEVAPGTFVLPDGRCFVLLANGTVVDLPASAPVPENGKGSSQERAQPQATLTVAERKPKVKEAAPSEEWDPPIPFQATVLPPFPLDAFPTVLREYCGALAHQTQTDNELAGLVVLGCCAAALAKKVRVEPKEGWTEPPNLYGMVLQEPGTRKTAVVTKATRPFEDHEAERRAILKPIIRAAQTRYDIQKLRVDRLKAEASIGDKDPEKEKLALEAAAELEALRPPPEPKLLVEDVTSEKLGSVLAENDGRIGIITAEGGIIDIVCGRYSQDKKPNMDVFLKGHSGDLIKVDRIGRPSLEVTEPAITMILAVQRDVLRSMSKHQSVKGRGLQARFLYAVPSDRLGFRDNLASAVPRPVSRAYEKLMHALLDIPLPSRDTSLFVVKLSDDAHRLLFDFDKENEPELRRGGYFELYKDWMGKLTGVTARLALIVHCVEWIARGEQHGTYPPISGDTMAAAIQLARFFMAHMRQALYEMGNHDAIEAKAERIAAWLVAKRLHQVTARDLQQNHRDMFDRMADVTPVLQRLVEHGVLRLARSTGSQLRGRPAAPTYDRNPLWRGE